MSLSILSNEDLLTPLLPELRSLARRSVLRTYRKNAVLINEGGAGDNLFVLGFIELGIRRITLIKKLPACW